MVLAITSQRDMIKYYAKLCDAGGALEEGKTAGGRWDWTKLR
jgi:hypothetical protein